MKTIIQILTISFLLVVSERAYGQDFQIPQNYTLNNKEDFAKYENDVINCIHWLENTPINQQIEKRKEASKFFIAWISGSPNVSVELRVEIIKFSDKNPDLLVTFMGGWTIFVLQNPNEQKDLIKANLEGLKSVIKVYQMGNGIKKDKVIDKLITLNEKGDLENWIKEQLKI